MISQNQQPNISPAMSKEARSQQERQNELLLAENRNKTKRIAIADSENSENNSGDTKINQPTAIQKIEFPKRMLVLAIIFDVVGLIPVVNFATEPAAIIIFGYWQKKYQNTDILNVLLNAVVWKGADAITIGILPSNSGLVIRAYYKKKMSNMV